MEVCKGVIEEVLGNADSVSFQENTVLQGQLVLGASEMIDDSQDLLEADRPSPDGKPVQSAVHKVTLDGSSNGILLCCGQLYMLDVLVDRDR